MNNSVISASFITMDILVYRGNFRQLPRASSQNATARRGKLSKFHSHILF